MPFRSQKQRAYFHYLKSQGKMDQATIDKWEAHTPKDKKLPKYVEKKANMRDFWTGFSKHAVETYVDPETDVHNAPKLLKWNEQGGVDPRTPEELQAAQAANLVTLPHEVEGATCATCMFFRGLSDKMGTGFCTNPEIKMDVSENMHCANWQHPGSLTQEPPAEMVMPQDPAMGQQPGQPLPEAAPQAGMDLVGASAQPQEQAAPQEQSFSPSPVANQSGFPQGQQTSQNPLVEQAVQDFQGMASVAGPTGGDGGDIGSASEPKKPAEKKSDKKDGKKSSAGHTININVGKGEKVAFWEGFDKQAMKMPKILTRAVDKVKSVIKKSPTPTKAVSEAWSEAKPTRQVTHSEPWSDAFTYKE